MPFFKNRPYLLPPLLLGLAAVVLVVFVKPTLVFPEAPPISWNPSQVVEQVAQGATKSTEISFTSTQNLTNVAVRIVPELQPYVSATPSSFSSISPGTQVTITLTFSAPTNAPLGTFEGIIQLKNGTGKSNKTYTQPLPVTLIVFSSIANAPNPEEVLEELTSDLRSGNINAALQKVAPSRHNQVRALDSNGLNRLADFLANARLVETTATLRVYEGTFVDEDGKQWEGEITQAFELGEWKIIAW